jgi:hypothetical protein
MLNLQLANPSSNLKAKCLMAVQGANFGGIILQTSNECGNPYDESQIFTSPGFS